MNYTAFLILVVSFLFAIYAFLRTITSRTTEQIVGWYILMFLALICGSIAVGIA